MILVIADTFMCPPLYFEIIFIELYLNIKYNVFKFIL